MEQALDQSRVVALVGARQTGKSTVARGLGRPYYTLDDLAIRSLAQGDPVGFARNLPLGAVIDEVQLVPELLRAIKAIVDVDETRGRFLLTGSANILSLPKLADPLVGRMQVLTLHPLAEVEIENGKGNAVDALFADALEWPEISSSMEDLIGRLQRGGYPEVLRLVNDSARSNWFSSYILGMLQREVREIARISDIASIEQVLRIVAARSGRLLSPTNLSSDTGIPKTTLQRYVGILELAFLVDRLPAWGAAIGRRAIKAPKILLNDVGLAAHELGADFHRLSGDRNLLGGLFETFAINEIRKQASWSRARPRLFHYRSQGGAEIDLILERADGVRVALEIKVASSVQSGDLRALRELTADKRANISRAVVLYTGNRALHLNDVAALPIAGLWHPAG